MLLQAVLQLTKLLIFGEEDIIQNIYPINSKTIRGFLFFLPKIADYIRVRISFECGFHFFFFRLEKIAIILMLFEKLGVIFDMMHKLRDARLVALIKTIIYFGIFCSNLSIFNRRYNHN